MGEDGVAYAHTGERWECAFRPRIWPRNPYDPDEYSAILHITDPNGDTIQRRAFYFEAMQSFDRGDKEIVEADGFADFRIRFRPRMPGRHTCVLHIQRDTGTVQRIPLPSIEVQGAAWDDYVRVDAHDPRFYARGTGDSSSIWWPVGLNIAAPQDVRGQERYQTTLTPDRGNYTYQDYFDRLSAAGGDAVEIWLSTWNVALEWQAGWPGWWGAGQYNQGTADRLDRLLDMADKRGMKLILNIDNHGKAQSGSHESQWKWHPFNQKWRLVHP